MDIIERARQPMKDDNIKLSLGEQDKVHGCDVVFRVAPESLNPPNATTGTTADPCVDKTCIGLIYRLRKRTA